MNISRTIKRTSFLAILLVTVISIGRSDLYRDISSNWRMVYEVYKRVMTDYTDQIDPKKLAAAGIEGMLSELDPYSVYLEDEDRHQLNLLTRGNYGGVGIQLGVRNDSLTVIAPIDDSPAKRAGIITNDKIIAVDGQSSDEMSLDKAADKIRGPKNSKVTLTIRRWGEEDIDFVLTRSLITVKDVSYSGMINDDTGYIRLNRFSRNSSVEMRQVLRSLENQEAEKIILDLRGNPGGLMDAAVQILDMLVEEGIEVVSMSGRSEDSKRTFTSQNRPILNSFVRLAVLIDGGSASASEIVAGAIQDLDRGIVVGTNSFGKGLVQTAFQLDETRTLKMTTAKYYIPSGRLIQKPGYLRGNIATDSGDADSVFATVNGRRVISNGGITPDFVVEQERTPMLTRECWRKGLFYQFSNKYQKDHELKGIIEITDEIIEEFRTFISMKELDLKSEGEKELAKLEEILVEESETDKRIEHSLSILRKHYEQDKDDLFNDEIDHIRIMLERDMSWAVGGLGMRIESSFDDDPVVLKAIEVLADMYTYGSTLDPSMN
ncbi:MAG TPA: S41 family peptidase [Candidatus Marinimicrobia bacterium]|nr:S41 family peptidase [Candidatus Neomarinimicrobiota bacterium]HIO74556.1 S41 family peptidase [Candidatus Neomarinimicrobiota bacterium]